MLPVSTTLHSERRAIVDTVRDFCAAEIRPNVMRWDESQEFPKDVFRKLGELGFLGVLVPEEYGGADLSYMSATIEELLLCAEYLLSEGNYDVILCERGVRTFSNHTRNTLDLSAIPYVQRISHLPILVDPSHGTGKRSKVLPLSRAAVAVGADGVLVEVHHEPEHALSDGPQAILPQMFADLVGEIRRLAPVVGRTA